MAHVVRQPATPVLGNRKPEGTLEVVKHESMRGRAEMMLSEQQRGSDVHARHVLEIQLWAPREAESINLRQLDSSDCKTMLDRTLRKRRRVLGAREPLL